MNDENANPQGKKTPKAAKTPRRDALSPAGINTIFKASKGAASVERPKAVPQTPRHIRPGSKPVTPRHKVVVGSKPNTPKRLFGTPRAGPETPSHAPTVLSSAKALFTRSAAPGELVGRDEERAEIDSFIEQRLSNRTGGCLYVSGPPGTGKSAMLSDRLNKITEQNVRVANINCVSIRNERDLYDTLAGELLDDGTGLMEDLKKVFVPKEKDARELYIVVLDEIDHLLTKDQELLHNLFEWSLVKNSKLVLLGIANALDLTDRFLPRLKALNLQPNLLPFKPYSTEQIASIITTRLKSLLPEDQRATAPVPFMHPAAIQLCARKVSSSTGDLRKAFDICRAAFELVEADLRKAEKIQQHSMDENSGAVITSVTGSPVRRPLGETTAPNTPTQKPAVEPKVLISHIARVSSAAFSSSSATSRLQILNLQQKAVLCSLVIIEKSEGSVSIPRLFSAYTTLCKRHSMLHPLSSTEFRDVLANLEGAGVCNFSTAGAVGTPSKRQRFGDGRKVSSAVREMDVLTAVAGVGGGILSGLWKEADF